VKHFAPCLLLALAGCEVDVSEYATEPVHAYTSRPENAPLTPEQRACLADYQIARVDDPAAFCGEAEPGTTRLGCTYVAMAPPVIVLAPDSDERIFFHELTHVLEVCLGDPSGDVEHDGAYWNLQSIAPIVTSEIVCN
jgi:hypothetical protein